MKADISVFGTILLAIGAAGFMIGAFLLAVKLVAIMPWTAAVAVAGGGLALALVGWLLRKL